MLLESLPHSICKTQFQVDEAHKWKVRAIPLLKKNIGEQLQDLKAEEFLKQDKKV